MSCGAPKWRWMRRAIRSIVGTILLQQRMIGGQRRAMSGEQRVAEAFAGLDHDFLRARDRD